MSDHLKPGDPTTGRRVESFVLVTGNAGKKREAERILARRLATVDVDLPEIQGLDLEVVLERKAHDAFAQVAAPVVVEETGLELAAMNGFPGPLVKWMLEAMGADGIARCADGLGDPTATAVCSLAFYDGDRMIVARGETKGRLISTPRGARGFGWDPFFVPAGHELSYAELGDAVKDRIGHRGLAWRAFRDALEAAGVTL